MQTSRTANSLRNMAFGLGSQALSILIGFVTRWVFIVLLGKEYLGVSGLFSNILSLLSLANLGFSSAIIYSLYKPLADKDMVSVKGYMDIYRKIYAIVGVVIFLIGCALMPFLPHLISGEVSIRENLYLIYFLFLLESSVSYFFSYKQALLTASQQNSVISAQHMIWMLIRNLAEIIVLYITHAYIPVLIAIVICQILENAWIARVADRYFPVLKDDTVKGSINSAQKASLWDNVKALLLYKISGTVISSTDNILIAKFKGLVSVGLYSNYAYIVDVIRTVLSYVFNSLTASVGNYNATESREANEKLFYNLFFASFWFYGFCAVCLGILINPFISLWLGKDYLLDTFTVIIIIINFYTAGVQYPSTTYREVAGLFAVGRYRPLIAAILNLLISIVLANHLGIAGIILGTIISRICVYFWYDPYIIHKTMFECNLRHYFFTYFKYFSATAIAGVLCYLLCQLLPLDSAFLHFAFSMIICASIPNILFFLLFRKCPEFQILKSYTLKLLRTRKL